MTMPIPADQAEMLRDSVAPIRSVGDSDNPTGAAFLYAVASPVTDQWQDVAVTIEPGLYVRTVNGQHVRAYRLDSLREALALLAQSDTDSEV